MLRTVLSLALLGTCASAAWAVALKQIEFKTGTAGLQEAILEIHNAGPGAIACMVEFAHWYSSRIGTAAPGKVLRVDLWYETATGTYVMLNARRENLPVESLWCGIEGHSYATRSLLPLERKAGARVSKRVLTCATGTNGAECK